jgi:hypothetical protein
MTKKEINAMAHNYISLAKDNKEVDSLEILGVRIVPYNVSDEWERLYIMAVNLLNFYEPDIRHESLLTYNLIITDIANSIKHGN